MGPLELAQELSEKSKPIQEKFVPNCEALTEIASAAVMEKAGQLLMVGRSQPASQTAPVTQADSEHSVSIRAIEDKRRSTC
jgi:hypothetical protein